MGEPARPVASVRRKPLYEQVAERLRGLIAHERLEPGDRLPAERELAVRLMVSRGSVRQALTILRVMGLVEIRHGNGIYMLRPPGDLIPPITIASIGADPAVPEVSEVREVLEAHAARLAARHRSARHLSEMANAISEMETEIQTDGPGIAGDQRFHHAVVTAAGNTVLATVLDSLEATVRDIARASLKRPGQPPRSLATHRLIFEAITRQDEEEAQRLMYEHLAVTGALEPNTDETS